MTSTRYLIGVVSLAVFPLLGWTQSEGRSARDIEAVVLTTGWSAAGVGGSLLLKYKPAVLYKDGSFSRDADKALTSFARSHGRWKRDGDGFTLQSDEGKTLQVPAKMRARPARSGQSLEGVYRSTSGVGMVNTGVSSVVAYKAFTFHSDGRLDLDQGAGAQGGGVTTSSQRASSTQYKLDGYTITVQHGDGRREQRLFYLFPDSDRTVGVGVMSLTARR